MFSQDNDSSTGKTLAALIAGVGIGFGLGILYAPNTGRKTRAALAKKADRSLNAIRDRADDLRSTAADLYEKGLDGIQSQKETLSRGLDQVKKAYKEVAS